VNSAPPPNPPRYVAASPRSFVNHFVPTHAAAVTSAAPIPATTGEEHHRQRRGNLRPAHLTLHITPAANEETRAQAVDQESLRWRICRLNRMNSVNAH
jgi:hypothetical protein